MPEKTRSLNRQVTQMATRLDKLEAQLGHDRHRRVSGDGATEFKQFCSLPILPERAFGPEVSPNRERLIRYLDKKWVNGTKLRYYFFTTGSLAGADEQKDMVREGFGIWEDVSIGISFEEVEDISEAEIRIAFLRGDGAWSYVGRDVIDVPGQFEPTMNFGWDLTRDPRGVDTAVHEIGHTLGFPHEHQNPFAGIRWDEEAVYDYFGGPPNNWPRQTTFHNVLRKLPPGEVEGSDWDPDSVMHYGFPAGLIVEPEQYRGGLNPQPGLSEADIEEARRLYPSLDDAKNPRLVPFKSELLSLSPGEQKDFNIEPDATRAYTLQTFGDSDTVMILFERQDGELRYVAGDDDSGTRLNARISTRMYQGKEYVLRIRLYLNYASGDTAVMLW